MDSPYLNTILYTNVTLKPNQMNNNVYLNLKDNLIKSLKRRNFGDYGYIVDIFEILSYDNNSIEAENTMAAAVFDVKFSCRLCRPVKGMKIICEVDKQNKVLIRLKNGPLYVIITSDRFNSNVFFKDNNKNLRYKDGERSTTLKVGDYVKVSLVQLSFNAKGQDMISIGFLENIATVDEIKKYHMDEYNNSGSMVNYDEYIKEMEKKNDDNNENDVDDEERTD